MADQPLTQDQLLDVMRRSVPRAYWESVSGDPSFALFRGVAAALAHTGKAMIRSAEARYRLPSSRQVFEPASGPRKASGTVTMQRVGSAADAFVATPGQLVVKAAGRTYLNAETVTWEPGDRGEREISYECDVAGFAGNLDGIRSATEGMLPDGLVTIAPRSLGRTGVGGTIDTTGPQTVVRDTGGGDLFRSEDRGLYLIVVASTAAANVGQVRQVTGYQRVGDAGQVALDDLVRRTAMEVVVGDDSGPAYTDSTMDAATEASSWTALPVIPAADDALYIGHSEPFAGAYIHVETPAVGDWAMVAEYWDGSAWSALGGVTDESIGLLAGPGVFRLTWDVPADWAALASLAATGVSPYYVRLRVAAFTEPSPEPPTLGRVVVLVQSPLVADAGGVTWQIADATDLSVTIVQAEAFAGGRDDDLYILGDDRGVYRAPGETEDQFRDRLVHLPDAVTPAAVQRQANRAIRPSGYRALVLDVGPDHEGGYTGYYTDVDALDYYEPGDVYPTDPYKHLLAYDYVHGGGWVFVPQLGIDPEGVGVDDGPVVPGAMAPAGPGASAADAGFLSDSDTAANGLYAAVYAAVDRARVPGVVFELVRDDSLNVLGC